RTPRESGPRERSASPPVNPLLHRLAPFAVGAVALVYQLPFFDRWFSVMDEGHMLQFADLIASGGMIYRDATSYPLPGAFYLLALVFRWFEPSILLSRWVVAIEFALFVPLVFLVIRRLLPLGWSLLAVGVLLLYRAWAFPHWQMYSYSTTAMLVLAASWVALVQFLASEDRRWLALSGLLFGLGVFCKQDYGAAMLLATIGTLVIYAHTGPAATRKPLLQLFATFLLPGAIVGAGAGLHFWLQGQLAFVIQLTVLNHFVGLASYDYQSFPSLLPLFQQDPALRTGTGLYNNFPALISTALGTAAFESTLVKETALYDTALKAFIYLPNLLIPAGALRLWHIRSEFPDPDTRTRALCETALFSVAAAFIILIRIYKPQDYVHLAVLYWPLLCLGVVYAHALLANRGGVRRGIAWLLLILLLGLSGYTGHLLGMLRSTRFERVPSRRAGIFTKPTEAQLLGELIDYVRANSEPNETVAAIPYFPIVLFLADRDAPHAASYIVWPFPEYPDREQRIIDAMEAHGTDTVLYNFSQFPNFPPVPEYVPDLYNHLVEHFEVDQVFSDVAFGYKLAALRRDESRDRGSPLFEPGDKNELRSERAAGASHSIPASRRSEWLAFADWPFRPTLALRPTAGGRTVLSRELHVPDTGASLITAIGIHPDSWFRYPPSWTRFTVVVVADGKRRELFTRKLDPHQVLADRGWFEVDVSLDTWRGRSVTLELETRTALPSGESLEMGGWALPRLLLHDQGAKR
ncbi:MAG: glycosyltransferase family 39 protein, partial [Deltaproteobacteria bacterium]|nr:glycosyltransferase family 39 protein [Deltaproteobacteria bacterium]